jgi:HK97 family phage major capsid protein
MKTSTRQAILTALKAARDLADAADAAGRDLSEEERAQVTGHLQKAAELKSTADNDAALRKQLGDLTDGIGLLPEQRDGGNPNPKPDAFHGVKRGKTIGQSFVESAEFKGLMGSVPEGRFSEKSRVQSQPYGIKALITGLSESSAGALVDPQQLGLLDSALNRPLTVRQLFTQGTTQTDTIEYVRLLSQTNNAAPVAEATTSAAPTSVDAGGALVNAVGGGYKPESAFVLEKASTTVKTIAHWIPATKRSLSDAAQVKTLIDTFLQYGLEEEFEDQLITGNGTGENFTGINNVSGIQTQIAPAGAQDVLDVTRIARRKVRIGGRAVPTAYVMNPIDWEGIELMRDADGRFLGAGPFNTTDPRLWGLPVVESEAVTAGTAWVADWRMGVIWDREQASIQVTDSHADFFIRNLVAILAEMRAAFAVLRPAAFVKIALA